MGSLWLCFKDVVSISSIAWISAFLGLGLLSGGELSGMSRGQRLILRLFDKFALTDTRTIARLLENFQLLMLKGI